MNISVIDWEKFNPRGDIKKPSWFRLENEIFSDPNLFDFNGEELLSWIYILANASKDNTGRMKAVKRHVEVVGKVKWKSFLSALEKLQELQCITVDVTGANVGVTDSHATGRDGTGRNGTNGIYKAQKTLSVKDFENIYELYPRKVGKQRGFKSFQAQIKTQEDAESLRQAVLNYCEYCKKHKTETQYIKHFSTFMNNWKDFLEIPSEQGFDESGLTKEQKREQMLQESEDW